MTALNDNFSLGIAESVRVRCSGNALDANNPPIIYVAMGLNVFMRCCRSFRCEGNYSPPTLTRICCRDLVREFTPQRLEQFQDEIELKCALPERLVKPLSYIALTFEILATSAAKVCPDLQDQLLRKFWAYLIEEFTVERVQQLQSAAAVTVH